MALCINLRKRDTNTDIEPAVTTTLKVSQISQVIQTIIVDDRHKADTLSAMIPKFDCYILCVRTAYTLVPAHDAAPMPVAIDPNGDLQLDVRLVHCIWRIVAGLQL
jgi:hypothetical protein